MSSPVSPCTPSRPYPSRAVGEDSERKVPHVLRLVAKPHVKIVPGKVATKDVLACAAANASLSTAPSSSGIGSSRVNYGEVPSSSRSTFHQPPPPLCTIDDDSLWDLVWQPIENLPALCAPQPGDVSPVSDYDRKRPRSKPTRSRGIVAPTTAPGCIGMDANRRPSCSEALELYPRISAASGSPTPVRRRLRGKQPNPDGQQAKSRSPTASPSRPASTSFNANSPIRDSNKKPQCRQRLRGHYDVLGLLKAAAGSEIRAAYRRMALATHPDKGGDPEDFRRVVVAFEELGDESKRAAYDRNLELFGSRDGSGLEATELVGMAVDAHAANPMVSQTQDTSRAGGWPPSSWPEDVARWWYGAARVALFKLMDLPRSAWVRQIASMHDAELQALLDLLRGAKILVPAQSGGPQGAANRQRPTQDDCGIQRSGSGYKVVMSWANLSISSAYTASLAQAIDWQIAFAWLRSTAQARLEECLGQAANPLLDEELLEVLAAEPAIDFTFTFTVVTKEGKKVLTPPVSDLFKALTFQQRLRTSAARSIKTLETKFGKEALEHVKETSEKKKVLLGVALKELQKRTGDQIPKGKKPPASMKRPASADRFASDITVSAYTFKPTRRVRSKSSPALLAFVQGPKILPDEPCQEIASGPYAWQGPQSGSPLRRQPGSPATRQPGTPARVAPGSPGSPCRSNQRSPSRDGHVPGSPVTGFRLSNLCSSPPPRNAPRSPLRSPMPSSLLGSNASGLASPLRSPMPSSLLGSNASGLASPLRSPMPSSSLGNNSSGLASPFRSRSPLRGQTCSPLRKQSRSPLRSPMHSPMRSPVAKGPARCLFASP